MKPTLAISTKSGIHVRLPDGKLVFIKEPESEWYKTRLDVSKFLKPPTAYRVAKALGMSPRTVRVVRTLAELN